MQERSARRPFSFGLVVDLLAVIVGAILYMTTQQKKAAVVMVGVGAATAILTLVVLILAVNSGM